MGGYPRLREAGDSALLLELEPRIGADVNDRAIAIADALRGRRLPGVRDVVSAYRSVAVFFDPLVADVPAVARAIHELLESKPPARGVREIEIDAAYGGEFGPDLAHVAAVARRAPEEVVRMHASRTYRVFMLGFLPGFAYMGVVDDAIAMPRRAEPRVRVPAGSVGIAGRQTGIYPRESPGGWQIIGRTMANVFDSSRTPPALFAPGDQVRFVPVRTYAIPDVGAGFSRPDEVRLKADPTYVSRRRTVTVLRPGLLTTIQDEGRWGHQHEGVSVSGPMDIASHRTANVLVGNDRDAATLEVTLLGPELRFEQPARVAVAGADLAATLDDTPVAPATMASARAGSILRFGERRHGARAYVAVDGGFGTPLVLGSRATHVLSGLGGIDGRAIRAGDVLAVADERASSSRAHPQAGESWLPPPVRGRGSSGAQVRVLRGPQDDHFAADAFDLLQRTRFTISPRSDRMGYRLTADERLRSTSGGDMISDITFAGGIQVPPSGEPILLMADRQTTGGYPQIATVITADLPLAGQLAPGDWIEFRFCTLAEARAALVARESHLLALN